MILAPEGGDLTPFTNIHVSGSAARHLLHKLQSFRGDCYLKLGAVKPHQLDGEGKHIEPQDGEAWHLLSMKENDELAAILRFIPLEGKREFRVGGWCVCEQIRGSRQAFDILMAAYALGAVLGVHKGFATATSSLSDSAQILKKIGGQFVRSYYDDSYGSWMEEIRFDLEKRNPKFEGAFQRYKDELRGALVIPAPSFRGSLLSLSRNLTPYGPAGEIQPGMFARSALAWK